MSFPTIIKGTKHTSRRGGSATLLAGSVQPDMAKQQREIPGIETAVPPQTSRWSPGKQSVVFLVRSDVKKELERGKHKFESGDLEGAKVSYETALDLDPSCAIAYFYLGFTFHEMGNHEMAKEYYLQAIDIEKRQSLFLEHLARLHFELGEYSVCLVRFQEAQAAGPLQPISYGLMGRAHYELDRFAESIDCLEKMLDLEGDPRLRRIAAYYLVLSHLKDGSMVPARRRALMILDDPDCDRVILSSLADRFQAAGCLSLALALLEKMPSVGGDDSERIEEVQSLINQVESGISKLFVSDEEKVLHHLHFISRYGTDRIQRVLLTLLEMPSPLVREAVISYCRKFGYEAGQDILAEFLSGPPLLHEAALLYLADTFEPNYTDLLLSHLHDPSKETQVAIARFLERCGRLEHVPVLEGQMEQAVGAGLRRQIQRAINQIKRRHTEQTDKLIHHGTPTLRKLPPPAKKPRWGVLQWTLLAVLGCYLVFQAVLFLVA